MSNNAIHVNEIYSDEDIRVIKNLIDPSGKLGDEQINLFLHVCKEKRLDPRTKQIYAVPRWNGNTKKTELTIQTSIDGFRLIAERTGKYSPGKPTVFHYNEKHQLTGATSFVKKYTNDGTWHEVSATAFLHEYKPTGNNHFWSKMPSVMIEKVAESKALRRAFPGDFSGIYTDDEMAQAKPSPDTEKEKAIEHVEIITDSQAQELDDIIGEDVKYRQSILRFLKSEHGLDSFIGMPLIIFNRALKVAKERAKQRDVENSIAVGE